MHNTDGHHFASDQHFVVCGDNPITFRLVDELVAEYDGRVVVLASSATKGWVRRIRENSRVQIVRAALVNAEALGLAGIDRAAALALVNQDDGANIDAALLARELRPDLRIVIRMSNPALGERIAALLNNCAVLSATAIAAPAFVAAALGRGVSAPIHIGGQSFVSARRSLVSTEDVVCGLAITGGREVTAVLPAEEAETDVVLAKAPAAPISARRRRRPSGMRLLPIIFGARLRWLFAALAVVFVGGVAAFMIDRGESLGQASYEAILAELGGANADPSASTAQRLALVILTFASVAVIPAVTVAVVDSAVRARLRVATGGLLGPIAGHIVVVGLGNVGTQVVRDLDAAGISVVAVETSPTGRGVPAVRALGVPIVEGDATRPEVLAAASIKTCRAIVVASTDDVNNLEIALVAREANPGVRVVLRIFDGEFAHRVQRTFNIDASRSVSALAAPTFAAAMLGQAVIATIPVRRRVLLVTELPVTAGSSLVGTTVGQLDQAGAVRVLAIRRGGQLDWRGSPSEPLAATDRVIVVATRAGLADLVGDVADDRAGAKRTAPTQPIGPQDGASLLPA